MSGENYGEERCLILDYVYCSEQNIEQQKQNENKLPGLIYKQELDVVQLLSVYYFSYFEFLIVFMLYYSILVRTH